MPTAPVLPRPRCVLADAMVTSVSLRGTRSPADDRLVVALTLLVLSDDTPAVSVPARASVAARDLARLRPGAHLPVRLDPECPEEVRLPWFLGPVSR